MVPSSLALSILKGDTDYSCSACKWNGKDLKKTEEMKQVEQALQWIRVDSEIKTVTSKIISYKMSCWNVT